MTPISSLSAILLPVIIWIGSIPSYGIDLYRLSPEESLLFTIISTHPQQQREMMMLDPRLCKAARDHAKDMVTRGFFSHTNPEGIGPNMRVTRAGFPLPKSYSKKMSANNVESFYFRSGQLTATVAMEWFKSSPNHEPHVLGKNSYYSDQKVVGIGHAINPTNGHGAYVFISSHLFELPDIKESQSAPYMTVTPDMAIVLKNLVPTEVYVVKESKGEGLRWERIGCFIAKSNTETINYDLKSQPLKRWFGRVSFPKR